MRWKNWCIVALLSVLMLQIPAYGFQFNDYVGAGNWNTANMDSDDSGNYQPARAAIRVVDGSGLSGDLCDSGQAGHWLSDDADFADTSPSGRTGEWLWFDLGEVYPLGQSHFWNYNYDTTRNDRGLRNVYIDYSTDNSNWTLLAQTEFPEAPGTSGYPGFDGPDFAGSQARYICITATSNWGNSSRVGLDEMRIDVISPVAVGPYPADGATGVSPSVILAWEAGPDTLTHNVYLGTDEMSLPLAKSGIPLGQEYYDPCDPVDDSYNLDPNTTYYWRVDEVGTGGTVTGNVWSFKTSKENLPIPYDSISVSGGPNDDRGRVPERTIDGSGMNGDFSDTDLNACFQTASNPPLSQYDVNTTTGYAWLAYEFDSLHTLYDLWVWNIGYHLSSGTERGFRSVAVEYSTDGSSWTKLGDFEVEEHDQTTSNAVDAIIPFGGIDAKYVVLTANQSNGNWGEDAYGLGEVRFYAEFGYPSAPSPADSAINVDPDITYLTWVPPVAAASHEIYFSSNYAEVRDETITPVTSNQASYFPSTPLTAGGLYYWKVKEYDGSSTLLGEGPVWSFKVEGISGTPIPYGAVSAQTSTAHQIRYGSKTVDGSGMTGDTHDTDPANMWMATDEDDGSGNPAGTAGLSWILYDLTVPFELYELWVWNFNMDGYTNRGVQDATIQYSLDGVNWTTLMDRDFNTWTFNEAPASSTYAHDIEIPFGGVEAQYVLITPQSSWGDPDYEGLSEVRFYASTDYATAPTPANGDMDADKATTMLTWNPGDNLTSQEVYFGTSPASMTQIGSALGPDADSVAIPAGELPLPYGGEYYWRVDSIANGTTYTGLTWSFQIKSCLSIDDMEAYDSSSNPVANTWNTGSSGASLNTNDGLSPAVVWAADGVRSMALGYDNTSGALYSEASVSLAALGFVQDWATDSFKALSLQFYGSALNTSEPFYVGVIDSSANAGVVYYGDTSKGEDTANLQLETWHPWFIEIQDFADQGVNLSNVVQVIIGFGDRDAPAAGGQGQVLIDSINLCVSRCVPEFCSYDVVNDDCIADQDDLLVLANDWLQADATFAAQAVNSGLVVYYSFDGGEGRMAPDLSGNGYDALADSTDAFVAGGVVNGCLNADGQYQVTPYGNFLENVNAECTISFWAYGDPNELPTVDGSVTILHCGKASNLGRAFLQIGGYNDVTGVTTACSLSTGWDAVKGSHDDIGLTSDDPRDYEGQWNHYAFVKNATTGMFRIYINGVLRVESTDDYGMVNGSDIIVEEMAIAGNWNAAGYTWPGKLDEFRVYNQALAPGQIATLAGLSQAYHPLNSAANVSDDEPVNDKRIDLNDFSVLSGGWMLEQLWP